MKIFDLELASPCNAKCDFCPQKFNGVKRGRPFMDERLLDKVTAEIGALSKEERVHVVLCGMGENLLRKALVIRALDGVQRSSGGEVDTTLVTNGSTLTPDLLEHEAFRRIDHIQVSFTGHDKETYEPLYRLKFDQVVENVVAMNKSLPGKVFIHSVDLVQLRGHKSDFERFWNDRGLRVECAPLHSRGGHITDPEAYPGRFRPFDGCSIFDHIYFVSSDGFVLSCCHDVLSENVIGDLGVSTLAEVIEKKQQMRRDHVEGFRICGSCTDFMFDTYDRRPVAIGWRRVVLHPSRAELDRVRRRKRFSDVRRAAFALEQLSDRCRRGSVRDRRRRCQ